MRVILTGLARCYRRDTPILVATLSTRDTPIHAGHTRIAAQSCRNFGLKVKRSVVAEQNKRILDAFYT
jgi:hypothetical protein